MKKMSKNEMAKKLGYEYLGKGIDSKGDDGFIVRKFGESNFKNIGNTMEMAEEWLISQLERKEQ